MTYLLPEGNRPHPRHRKPQRISITISWALHQCLLELSDQEGRSLSNMAASWLERQAQSQSSSSPSL